MTEQSPAPLAAVAVAAVLASGCAVNGVGATVGRVTAAGDGFLYTRYGFGLNVEMDTATPGIALGLTAQTCLAAQDARAPAVGWYAGLLPALPRDCYARTATVWGSALRTGALDTSALLGYRSTTVLTAVDSSRDADFAAHVDFDRPENSLLVLGPASREVP